MKKVKRKHNEDEQLDAFKRKKLLVRPKRKNEGMDKDEVAAKRLLKKNDQLWGCISQDSSMCTVSSKRVDISAVLPFVGIFVPKKSW